MILTYLKSATVLIEEGNTRLLCDPWLIDGIYFGSWAHNPPYEWDDKLLSSITHIYVSHVHPDHLCPRTMAKLPKVPVIIHKFAFHGLRMMIEEMGFQVIEVPHGDTKYLGDLSITIFAADDCDPAICGKHFGCTMAGTDRASTQIDTLAVIMGDKSVVVNANDCPYELSETMIPKILKQFGRPDLLLVGYGGAGPYPQCFPEIKRNTEAVQKIIKFLKHGAKFIDALRPRYTMPFAGQYHLAGRLMSLNNLRGVASLEEAVAFYKRHRYSGVFGLNSGQSFDIDLGEQSRPYCEESQGEMAYYAGKHLKGRFYDYDFDPDAMVLSEELKDMTASAWRRLDAKRQELKISSSTRIYLPQVGATISLDKTQLDFNSPPVAPFISIDCDPKLYKRLLTGPKVAHWSNAEIGSHLRFRREPDVFDRSISLLMGSLYI